MGPDGSTSDQHPAPSDTTATPPAADDGLRGQVTQTAIVEAILFVGHEENRPIAAAELAEVIADADEGAIRAAVAELDALYQQQESALAIVEEAGGYRLVLRPDYHSVRDRFYGRVRHVKLSRQAMEVLAVVAYRQPVTADDVGELRGSDSRRIMRQLVRRQLLRVERPTDAPRRLEYRTTERFLQLFRLGGLDDLPQDEDLERS